MKPVLTAVLIAFAAMLGTAHAQTNSANSSKDVGYKSGSSDSGKSGMDSSRGVPTSPTAGQPGTVDNGNPKGPAGSSTGAQH